MTFHISHVLICLYVIFGICFGALRSTFYSPLQSTDMRNQAPTNVCVPLDVWHATIMATLHLFPQSILNDTQSSIRKIPCETCSHWTFEVNVLIPVVMENTQREMPFFCDGVQSSLNGCLVQPRQVTTTQNNMHITNFT